MLTRSRTFIISLVVFEIGSAICGAAQSSTMFILGRSVAGFASAGLFSGTMLIMIPMIPLHKRPAFQGIFGMVFGVASVMGPLVGGGFTTTVSWRWCFFINLPIGGVTLIFMTIFWNPPKQMRPPVNFMGHVKRLDPIGMLFFLPGCISLLLAMQWGGAKYDWQDWRIVMLFGIAVACTISFISVQIMKPDTAMIPPKVITQRSVAFGVTFTFFLAGSMLLMIFYVPIWCKSRVRSPPFPRCAADQRISPNCQAGKGHQLGCQHSPPRPQSRRLEYSFRHSHPEDGLLRPVDAPRPLSHVDW